jgi:uncharacterized protein YqhQ
MVELQTNEKAGTSKKKKFEYKPKKYDSAILITIDIAGIIVGLIVKDYFLTFIFLAFFVLTIVNVLLLKKFNFSLKKRALISRIASIIIGIVFLIYLYFKYLNK